MLKREMLQVTGFRERTSLAFLETCNLQPATCIYSPFRGQGGILFLTNNKQMIPGNAKQLINNTGT